MKTVERHKKTDFGDVWYVNAADGTYRFAVYKYDDDQETIYLSNVFVKEDSRRQGYGNEILTSAEDYANRLGASVICLKVLSGSDVHRWYKRHGYEDLEKDEEERGYMWMKKELKKVNESIWADIRDKSLGKEERGEDFDFETEDKIKEKDFNLFSEDIVFLGFENTLDGFKKSVHHHRFMGYYRMVVDIETGKTWQDKVVPFVEKNWDKRGYSKIVDEKVAEKEDELSKIGFKKEPGKTISKMLDDWWENIDEDTKEKISDYFYTGAEEKYYENHDPDYHEFNGDDFDVDDEWSNADWITCVKLYMDYSNKTNESVWGDIRKKSLGQEVRIEDDVNQLNYDGFFDYLLKHYTNGKIDDREFIVKLEKSNSITMMVGEHTEKNRYFRLVIWSFNKSPFITVPNDSFLTESDYFKKATKEFELTKLDSDRFNPRLIITPKDGSEVDNRFFINVIDSFIDNIEPPFENYISRKDVNESVWGDIRKKSLGQERKEDNVDGMDVVTFIEYLHNRYVTTKNKKWKVVSWYLGGPDKIMQWDVPIEDISEAGFQMIFNIRLTYDYGNWRCLDIQFSYPTFFDEYPEFKKYVEENYILCPRAEYDDESRAVTTSDVILAKEGDLKLHDYVNLIDKALSCVDKPYLKLRINESVWGDIRKKSLGQEERVENKMTLNDFKMLRAMVEMFSRRLRSDNHFGDDGPGFIEYIENRKAEHFWTNVDDETYDKVIDYVGKTWDETINGVNDYRAFLSVTNESVWADIRQKSLGQENRKEELLSDDEYNFLDDCKIEFSARVVWDNEKFSLEKFKECIKRQSKGYENVNVENVIKYVDDKWDELMIEIDKLIDIEEKEKEDGMNESCDGVPGGITPASVGGMGAMYFPGADGSPGSGDIPMPTGKVYQQVAPFGIFIKDLKKKKKRKKFRKEDEPCAHSPNAKVYDYVDDYREYVDRTYNEVDKRK